MVVNFYHPLSMYNPQPMPIYWLLRSNGRSILDYSFRCICTYTHVYLYVYIHTWIYSRGWGGPGRHRNLQPLAQKKTVCTFVVVYRRVGNFYCIASMEDVLTTCIRYCMQMGGWGVLLTFIALCPWKICWRCTYVVVYRWVRGGDVDVPCIASMEDVFMLYLPCCIWMDGRDVNVQGIAAMEDVLTLYIRRCIQMSARCVGVSPW